MRHVDPPEEQAAPGDGPNDGASDGQLAPSEVLQSRIDLARTRLAELRSTGVQSLGAEATSILYELTSSLENFVTMDIELRSQNERLLSTQRMLDSERRRYRELFNSAPDGYLITDPKGMIIEANWTASAMLNVVERFLRKKSLSDFIGSSDKRKLRKLLSDLQTVDRRDEWEIELCPVGATPFLAQLTVSASRGPDGLPSEFRWMIRDVTQRRQVEARLQRERQNRELAEQGEIRFRMLAENVPQLVWISNEAGKSEYLNNQWYEYTGLMRDEQGDVMWGNVHPDDLPATAAAWKDALRQGEVFEIEFRLRKADSSYRWFLARGTPLRDEEGRVVKMFGTCTDIHELREARQALERQWVALENIHDALVITDPNGTIQDCNHGFTQMFGYERSDAVGHSISIIHVADEYAAIRPSVMQIIRQFGRWSGEFRYRRKDNSYGVCETNIVPIRSDQGEIVALVGTCRDITEQKRAAAEIADLYAKEHRIAESLQRSILAKPPGTEFPGLEIETVYQPALDEAQVGGDYYDFFALPNSRVAMVVGDVSGKGLDAASRTAEVKFSLRAYMREYTDAASALTHLNACLCESQNLDSRVEDYFVCLTLAMLNTDTGDLDLAVAGTTAPLIIRTTGNVDVVEAAGMPLGIEPSLEYVGATSQLNRGDVLLIASDGIIEARRGREFLDQDGIVRLATQAASLTSVERIAQSILGGVRLFTGGAFRDDVCMLLARRD